jgi:predicted nucleotidyltransferase
MNDAAHILSWVSSFMDRLNIPWALVGGWAVSIRTEPRFTRDIDIIIATDTDMDAEGIIQQFISAGFSPQAIVEQDAVKRLATVRLRPPSKEPTGMLLDVLFASSGIEQEICKEAEILECFPGIHVPVARLEHLLALKILARDDRERPQDIGDIHAMLRVMTEQERERTRTLLQHITTRGFHRQRDLAALFEELVTPL